MENQIEIQQLLELDVQTLETLDQCSDALGRVSERADKYAEQAVTAGKSAIAYALKGGHICSRAKEIAAHGEFVGWLKEQEAKYGRSIETLYRWMRMAKLSLMTNLMNEPNVKGLTDAYIATGILPEPEPKQLTDGQTEPKEKPLWSPLKFSTRIEQWTKEQALDFIYEFDRAAQFVRALKMEFGV